MKLIVGVLFSVAAIWAQFPMPGPIVGGGGGGGSDELGYYLVSRSTSAPVNAVNLGLLTTGLLKISVAGAVATPSTAVSSTDFAPATSGSAILKGNGTGGFSSAVAGTDYALTWAQINNPAANLSLTMAANSTTFTYNATTGVINGIKLIDTASNSGTGILHWSTTASSSSMTPWQADSNGVGWKVHTDGSFQSVGSTASGIITFNGGTSGECNLTTEAVAVGLIPGSAAECHLGSKTVPFKGVFPRYLEGSSSQPAVNAASCTGATIGTGATNLAGTITGLPTGTCSVVVTMANSATSTTGWACAVSNQTTANLFRQTASSTTTVTFAGTSVSGDVLVYGPCAGY